MKQHNSKLLRTYKRPKTKFRKDTFLDDKRSEIDKLSDQIEKNLKILRAHDKILKLKLSDSC